MVFRALGAGRRRHFGDWNADQGGDWLSVPRCKNQKDPLVVEARQLKDGLIHLSDRGAQFTSDDFRKARAEHYIECSMSHNRNCYHNAVVGGFFSVLKRE